MSQKPEQEQTEARGVGKISFISYYDNGIVGTKDVCGDVGSACDLYFDPITIIGAK